MLGLLVSTKPEHFLTPFAKSLETKSAKVRSARRKFESHAPIDASTNASGECFNLRHLGSEQPQSGSRLNPFTEVVKNGKLAVLPKRTRLFISSGIRLRISTESGRVGMRRFTQHPQGD